MIITTPQSTKHGASQFSEKRDGSAKRSLMEGAALASIRIDCSPITRLSVVMIPRRLSMSTTGSAYVAHIILKRRTRSA